MRAMSGTAVDHWGDVEPLPPVNGDLAGVLASVDTLRSAWADALSRVTPNELAEARQRSLRRHAIETGIIERLYDIDWGVTEALIAEGLTAEVAIREGGVDEDTLAIIRSQHEALEFLAEVVREGQDLNLHSSGSCTSWCAGSRRPTRPATSSGEWYRRSCTVGRGSSSRTT